MLFKHILFPFAQNSTLLKLAGTILESSVYFLFLLALQANIT